MRKVTTQEALDQALAEGVIDLIVDAPDGVWLKINHDGRAVLRESSRAVLWGSSSAVLRESSRAVLWGSSSAVLRESSSAVLKESSRAVLRESSSAVLRESSSAVLRESSRAVLRESSRAELWGSSSAVLWESSSAVAGRWTSIHVWSQEVTLDSAGHVFDMTEVDLTDPATWLEYTGASSLIDAGQGRLTVAHVSSEDHPGTLTHDGMITIGCWRGDVTALRTLIAGDRWPSGADAETRHRYAPRIAAFADLCDAQILAWSETQ